MVFRIKSCTEFDEAGYRGLLIILTMLQYPSESEVLAHTDYFWVKTSLIWSRTASTKATAEDCCENLGGCIDKADNLVVRSFPLLQNR